MVYGVYRISKQKEHLCISVFLGVGGLWTEEPTALSAPGAHGEAQRQPVWQHERQAAHRGGVRGNNSGLYWIIMTF